MRQAPKSLTSIAYLLYGLTIWLLSQEVAFACPCGCGAASPEVMYPGEEWKYSLALQQQSGFTTIDAAGESGSSSGPDSKNILTLAMTRALNLRTSITGTVPLQRNSRQGEASNQAIGDPTVSGRYTIYLPDFVAASWPTTQITAALKWAQAKSLRETEDEFLLDVHGNGFNEATSGIEAFWGMYPIKGGIGAVGIYSQPRTFDEITYQPGPGYRVFVQSGYAWMGYGQIMVVAERETLGTLQVDGVGIADSAKAANNLTANGSLKVGEKKTGGISLKRTAAFGGNRNTIRSDLVTFSYAVAI